jgi:hypothetical protein
MREKDVVPVSQSHVENRVNESLILSFSQNDMVNYFKAYGLNEVSAINVSKRIESWIQCNGVEWTVSRLKDMKIAFIHRLAGYPKPFIDSPWIQHHSKLMVPKGDFKPIFLLKTQQALGCLMVYSNFRIVKDLKTGKTGTLESQNEKFLQGLGSTKFDFSDLKLDEKQYNNALNKLGKLPEGHFQPAYSWVGNDRSSPYLNGKGEVKTGKNNMTHLVESCSTPAIYNYFKEISKSLPKDLYSIFVKSSLQPCAQHRDFNNYVGKVSFIQESGLKLRSVAIPYLGYQVALSRLGTSIYASLRSNTSDSTFDQDKAVLDVQEYMSKDESLMSIDLSSATDTFPYALTRKILLDLGAPKADVDLLTSVNKGYWTSPLGDVTWTNGSALGVYPSFGAFALSHHVLALMAQPKFYRILGDDIVIDYESGVRLRELYAKLNLKISESKSITSSSLSEFGGRLITKKDIFIQPKWKDTSDNSFIQLAKNMGPSVKKVLRPQQLKVLKLLEEIPRDVISFGLNWNPNQKTYDQRLEDNNEVISKLMKSELTLKISPDRAYMKHLQTSAATRVDVGVVVDTLHSTSQNKRTANCSSVISFHKEIKSLFMTDLVQNLNIDMIHIDDSLDETPIEWRLFMSMSGGDPRGLTLLERLTRLLIANKPLKT